MVASTDDPGADKDYSCDLLPQAEAQRALGTHLLTGQQDEDTSTIHPSRTCDITSRAEGRYLTITVKELDKGEAADVRAALDRPHPKPMKGCHHPHFTRTPLLGYSCDEAYSGAVGTHLFTYDDTTRVDVSILTGTKPTAAERATALQVATVVQANARH